MSTTLNARMENRPTNGLQRALGIRPGAEITSLFDSDGRAFKLSVDQSYPVIGVHAIHDDSERVIGAEFELKDDFGRAVKVPYVNFSY